MNTILSATAIKRQIDTKSGPLTLLDNVSLELSSGESVAIQGASGSGKSTLLGVLAGLDVPQQGQVVIDGHDITGLNEDQRAQLRADKVGFVFQSFHLIDDLTALENVALPLELFGHRDPFKHARGWLNRVGLSERTGHRPLQLSGGEQQRVALCRAFAVEPDLLFADEPTANLDEATATTVLDQLFALHRELDMSMLVATHDTRLAQRCDRILRLESGKLVSEAPQ